MYKIQENNVMLPDCYRTSEDAKDAIHKRLYTYCNTYDCSMTLRFENSPEGPWVLQAEHDGHQDMFRIFDTDQNDFYSDPIGFKVQFAMPGYKPYIQQWNDLYYSEDAWFATKEEAEDHIQCDISFCIADVLREKPVLPDGVNVLDPDVEIDWNAIPRVKPDATFFVAREGDTFILKTKQSYPEGLPEQVYVYKIVEGYPSCIQWID